MGQDAWTSLAQPFPASALEWRVIRLDDDGLRAQARPQLRVDAVLRRLDETVGVAAWSNTLLSLGSPADVLALACTLTVEGVSKSAAASLGPSMSASALADDALVYAAERFHMLPPADLNLSYWVDYDKENQTMLYEPSAPSAEASEEGAPEPVAAPFSAAEETPGTETPSTTSNTAASSQPASKPTTKPAGQQAIDRLVERLGAEGKGLEVAKLINAYGGYGTDPNAARELYARLRELLRGGA